MDPQVAAPPPPLPLPAELRAVQATMQIRRLLLKVLTLFNANAFKDAKEAVVESVASQAQASNELKTALTALYAIAGAGPRSEPMVMITSQDDPMHTFKVGVLAGQFEVAEYARAAIRNMRTGQPQVKLDELHSRVINYTFTGSDHSSAVEPEADLGVEELILEEQFSVGQ